jgi:hypothetical protein
VQATVAYYLLLDDRLHTTIGYLGSDFQESMVSVIFFSLVYQDVDCKLFSTCDGIIFLLNSVLLCMISRIHPSLK